MVVALRNWLVVLHRKGWSRSQGLRCLAQGIYTLATDNGSHRTMEQYNKAQPWIDETRVGILFECRITGFHVTVRRVFVKDLSPDLVNNWPAVPALVCFTLFGKDFFIWPHLIWRHFSLCPRHADMGSILIPSKDSTFKISSIIQLARIVWVLFSALWNKHH